VKADCGGGDLSDWSATCEFTPTTAYSITVNDGTNSHSYVPFYGYYADSDANSQFIIPASELADMAWGTINKLTFYSNTASAVWTDAVFDIYFSEVNYTEFETAALVDWTELSNKVYTGSVSIANNIMELTLTTPYQYMGGNLLIGFDETTNSSNYPSASWWGVTQTTNTAVYKYSTNSPVLAKFLPKITFDYTPGEAPSCIKPTGFAVSNITARTADLSWNSVDAREWQICINDNEAALIDIDTNPYTLTGLDPETVYDVKIRANCGSDDYSDWTNNINFTTEPSCYAPTDMVFTDTTAYSINVGWSPAEGNFELRYAINPTTTFDDSAMDGWTTIDADGDGYTWVLGSACGGIYVVEGGSLAGSGHNSSADLVVSGSYSNVEGVGALTPDNYLVSPRVTLGGSISFWACAQDASYPAEHFGVAVSTAGNTSDADFTTLQEWTLGAKGTPIMLRSSNEPRGNNRAQGNWYQFTVDLSAYSGQGYVAIRHFDCTDQFMLDVDDILIEGPDGIAWIDVPNPTNPQLLTGLNDNTPYMVQVRTNCGADDGYSAWLTGTFTTLPSCMVPTDLVISNIGKRSADLAWTANGEEEAWQICLNGDEENLITVTTTSYSFTGLTPETRYTVKVRAYCDEDLQSAWSSAAIFTTAIACPAPTGLAISDITNVSAVATWTYDGDVELEYAEDVWKYYDNGTFGTSMGAGGTIYWGILLTPDMLPANQPLTHIAMYENSNNANPTTISIYSGGDAAPGTFLYSEEVTPVGNGFHEITLAEPVEFDATQNLWIVCYNDADTYPAAGSADLTNPNGRWVSLDGEEWADIDGYGYNYTWMIRAAFGDATTEWVAVNNPASPQTIAGLTPETNYVVRLRAVCGGDDGESVWVNTSFTTDEACPAPTALAATPYASSAVLSWEGISESYTVSYRTAAYTDGTTEEFSSSSTPTGWTRYNALLTDDVLNGTTALTTSSAGWNFGTGNGVFDSHAKINIYGTSIKYWLVTPAMTVPTDASFSFDLALTAFSGTNVPAPATTGTDDKFVVLVSTDNMATWTILRQWDNEAGSAYVYNNIANTANGERVIFDFSAYAGQTVNIAFYGESTVSNADNNLHIDNVGLGVAIPAGTWQTVTVDEATATLIGLTPETKYDWKVQGDCGEYGMSEESAIASFTTTNDPCPVPTNLTVDEETLTATTADLSWDGSPDVESFTVRYRVPEHVVGGLSETFDNNSVPASWMRYSGLVDDVVAGTATLTTTTSGWYTTEYALGTYNMKVNIYGTSAKYWLVTPEVTPTSGNLSFDLALTAYNSANAASGTCDDDRFVVLVYANEAWTILREWNNSGSDYVYNDIATTGEAVSIDLSAYNGQAVKIAFYGESTVGSNGDNDLHIDNVIIGNPQTIPATDWMTEERITETSVTLTGLTPETTYEAQVKADCSEAENPWSNVLTFTTTEEPALPLSLAAGINWVSFNVETTLDDLKAALVAALPGTNITIQSQTQKATYNGTRWTGRLSSIDVTQMYKIKVTAACELTLQGNKVNPADHPLTIIPGANWIAYELEEANAPETVFAGFAVPGDYVKSQTQKKQYNGTRWTGRLNSLEPGQGYIYNSASSDTRTFSYDADKGSKGETSNK
jgi:hypothetical protein